MEPNSIKELEKDIKKLEAEIGAPFSLLIIEHKARPLLFIRLSSGVVLLGNTYNSYFSE